MLNPERAVLVKRDDSFLGRHVLRAGLVGRQPHKLDDRLLRGAVIPGRQWVLSRRPHGTREQWEKRQNGPEPPCRHHLLPMIYLSITQRNPMCDMPVSGVQPIRALG